MLGTLYAKGVIGLTKDFYFKVVPYKAPYRGAKRQELDSGYG